MAEESVTEGPDLIVSDEEAPELTPSMEGGTRNPFSFALRGDTWRIHWP